MTWAPDDGPIQALIVDLSEAHLTEMRALIGTPEWAESEAVTWLPYRTSRDHKPQLGLFRLARITALEPIPTGEGTTP
jgi:hypothetical protein